MKRFLARLLRLQPDPLYRVTTLYSGLTLTAWQASNSRVEWARQQMATRQFRDMISVLQNGLPQPNIHNPDGLAAAGAFTAGYLECLNTLLAMTVAPERPIEAVEATYERVNTAELTPEEQLD